MTYIYGPIILANVSNNFLWICIILGFIALADFVSDRMRIVGQWDLRFILAKIYNTILWICIILGLLHWTDTISGLILNLGQYGIYFMAQ